MSHRTLTSPPVSLDRLGQLREQTWKEWQVRAASSSGLWVFSYGSLIWKPEIPHSEAHLTRVYGWHRALAMWSHINRGTPEQPGLVLALLPGGSCRGIVFRAPTDKLATDFDRLWAREMPDDAYTPRWLKCRLPNGKAVSALSFTMPRQSRFYTGRLAPDEYRTIFRHATGRYGTTLDYAVQSLIGLRSKGIQDHYLARIISYADDAAEASSA